MTATQAHLGRLTRADLDALPDDGLRHELLDGSIVLTPAPGTLHQRATGALFALLRAAVAAPLEAFVAPFDVALPTGDVVQPDVLVARTADLTERDLSGVPLLVVEVLSPSTRRRDLGDKLTAYRDAGIPHYWVLDPVEQRLVVHRLERGRYRVVAEVVAGQAWDGEPPLAVRVVPAELV